MNEEPTENLSSSPNDTQQILAVVKDMQARMERLEQKVEERLFDTRPIWEKVVADIAQLQQGVDSLRDETRTGLRNVKRQIGFLNETFMEMRADYRDLDRRVYQLEEKQGS